MDRIIDIFFSECNNFKNCLLLHFRDGGLVLPTQLRSMIVPTISLAECIDIYRGRCEVSNQNICTLDRSGRRACSHGDSGAPLVANSKLIAIHAAAGSNLSQINPDIYIKLSYPAYKNWIISHLRMYSVHYTHHSPNSHN